MNLNSNQKAQDRVQKLIPVIGGILLAFLASFMYTARFAENVYHTNSAVLPELITGPSVFKDYYKPADFLIPRCFILSFLLFFVLSYFIISFMTAYHEKLKFSFYVLVIAAGLILFKQYFGYDMRFQWIFVLSLFVLHIVDLFKQAFQKETYDETELTQVCTDFLLAYFAVSAFVRALLCFDIFSEQNLKKGFYILLALAYVVLLAIYLFGQKLPKLPLKLLYREGFQILLLCFLVSLFQFRLNYNGTIETASYTGVRILIVVLLAAVLVYAWLTRKDFWGKLHPYSVMLIAAMQLKAEVPVDALFPINLFHYGELTVPFSQMISYHKLPYLQFFPIHGICDYFFAGINEVILDGSYASFFHAYYIGSMILAALVGYIVYKCFDSEFYTVLFTVFFMTIGEWYYYFRFILVLPILLLFFQKKIRKNAYQSLLLYIVSSVVSIAWYPAIGGSLALALLLPLCMRIFSKKGRAQFSDLLQKDTVKKCLPSAIAVLLIGVSFIPMFLGILRYLKENMGISNYFPGDRLQDLILSSGGFRLFTGSDPFCDVFLIVFTFMLAILFAVGIAAYRKKSLYTEAAVTIVVFSYMICSYTFGSIFAGERASIVNVVCFILLAYLFFQTERKTKVLPAFFIAFALILNNYDFMSVQKNTVYHQQISDQFVKVCGEEAGFKKMGNVYTDAQTAQVMKDTAFVINHLCPEGETYLDFSNQSALYMMFDKETPFAYCALYHGTSEATRNQMFESLKENLPKLVLVSPYWNNDGGSISLRYKKIYQYILAEGYLPYQYNSVCFLLAGDQEKPDWAQGGGDSFFAAMTTRNLLGLPLAWGRSKDVRNYEDVPFAQELLRIHQMETDGNGNYQVLGEDAYFQIQFTGDTICKDAEYLLIHFYSEDLDEEKTDLKLYFSYPDGSQMEETAISCYAKNGDILIPLYAYPTWTMFEMTTIRFDMEDEKMQGKTFSASFELLKETE